MSPETILDAPAGIEVFYSAKHHNLRVIRSPGMEKPDGYGGYVRTAQEIAYQFEGNVLHIDPRDRAQNHVLADGPGGAEQDAIAFLTAHPEHGTTFVRKGHEPDRLLPSEDDFLSDVTDAVLVGDAEAIERLREQEEASHGRDVLLGACDSALEKLAAIEKAAAPRTSKADVARRKGAAT